MNIPAALVDALRNAVHVVALTGSGVSAESGVPTFRDAQTGLWARYRPEDLATPEAFAADPVTVWQWYAWRRELVSAAAPNPAHRALAELETMCRRFTLVTQNVDGLHQQAGSVAPLEFHGSLVRDRCTAEGVVRGPAPGRTDAPPLCQHCGALLRPDVVWFGEAIDPPVLEAAFDAARNCDVFLSVGTSSLVYPAAALAEVAASAAARVVEINPDATPLSARAEFVLRGPAGEILPRLVAALRGAR